MPMSDTELVEVLLSLAFGVWCLFMAYRACKTGEIARPDDNPQMLDSRREPGEFVNQVAIYILAGVVAIGFAA